MKFERLLETYLSYAPHGLRSFIAAMPVWLKEKLYLKDTLKRELADLGGSASTPASTSSWGSRLTASPSHQNVEKASLDHGSD